MKVSEVNIGNGIIRFEVEPSCICERNVPTHVVDNIIKDVIRQKNLRERQESRCFCQSTMTRIPEFREPSLAMPRCEPDGIDIHVDRPLRENFCSHRGWADAMAKYRTLEMVAKDCDWECKEPMRTLPNYRNFASCMIMDDMCDEPWF